MLLIEEIKERWKLLDVEIRGNVSFLMLYSCRPLNPDQTFLPSCPDKNKVHFNPTGSAFCRFSLVKPLIPNVDFLFRDFTSSPSPMPPGTFSSCQPTSAVPVSLRKDSRGDNFIETPKSPPLNLESWKRSQAEDTVLFHSSLVVWSSVSGSEPPQIHGPSCALWPVEKSAFKTGKLSTPCNSLTVQIATGLFALLIGFSFWFLVLKALPFLMS